MAIQKNANLDISVAAEQNPNYNVKPSVQFSTQDRNTAKYTFTVKQNNKVVDLTDVTATVTLFMADKSVFQNNAVVTNAKEGKIEYTIPSDAIRHHGSAKGELKLTYANGDVLGGLRFSFNIEQSLIDKVDGSQKEVYIEDFQTISNTVKKKAEEVTVKLDKLDEEYQNKAYTVDEKLANVQATVNDLRENGTGIDAQARQEVQQVSSQLADIVIQSNQFNSIAEAINYCFTRKKTLKLINDYAVDTSLLNGFCSLEGNNKKLTLNGSKTNLPINSNTKIVDVILDYQSSGSNGSLFKGTNIKNFKADNISFNCANFQVISKIFSFYKSENIEFTKISVTNVATFIETQQCKNITLNTFHLTNYGTLLNATFDQTKGGGESDLVNESLWCEDIFVSNIIAVNTLAQCNESTGNVDLPLFTGYGSKNYFIKNVYAAYPRLRMFYCSAGKNVNIENIEAIGHASFKFCGWHKQGSYLTSDGFTLKNVRVKGDRNIIPGRTRMFLDVYFSKNIFVEDVTVIDYPETAGTGLFTLSFELTNVKIKDINIKNVANNKIIFLLRNTTRPGDSSLTINDLTEGIDYNALLDTIHFTNFKVADCSLLSSFVFVSDDHTNSAIGYKNMIFKDIELNNCSQLTNILAQPQPSENIQVMNTTYRLCPSIVLPSYRFTHPNNVNISMDLVDKYDDTEAIPAIPKLEKGSNYRRIGNAPIISGSATKGSRIIKNTGETIEMESFYTLDTSIDTNGARPFSTTIGTDYIVTVEVWDSTGTYAKGYCLAGGTFNFGISHANVANGYPANGYGLNYTSAGILEIRDLYKVNKKTKIQVKAQKT